MAVHLVQSGLLGKVKTVNVTLPGPNWIERAGKPVPNSTPPRGFDFDRWLGPAPPIVNREANTAHVQNFIDCIKSRKTPVADISIGHRSATVCHLGNIAIRTGKRIQWDPTEETIVGDSEASKWLTKEYRAPYSLA